VDPNLSASRSVALTGDGQSPAAGLSLAPRLRTYPQVQVEKQERAVIRRESECEVYDQHERWRGHLHSMIPPANPTVEKAYGALKGPITSVVILGQPIADTGTHQVEHHAPARCPQRPSRGDLVSLQFRRELLSIRQRSRRSRCRRRFWMAQSIPWLVRPKSVFQPPEPRRLRSVTATVGDSIIIAEVVLTVTRAFRNRLSGDWRGRSMPRWAEQRVARFGVCCCARQDRRRCSPSRAYQQPVRPQAPSPSSFRLP
jgi:hypothetical protein